MVDIPDGQFSALMTKLGTIEASVGTIQTNLAVNTHETTRLATAVTAQNGRIGKLETSASLALGGQIERDRANAAEWYRQPMWVALMTVGATMAGAVIAHLVGF